MSKFTNVLAFVKHYKYLITIVFFTIVLGFVGDNSFLSRYRHKQEIGTLKNEILKQKRQYRADTERFNELTTDPKALEKIARERYFMKAKNEDVFVIDK